MLSGNLSVCGRHHYLTSGLCNGYPCLASSSLLKFISERYIYFFIVEATTRDVCCSFVHLMCFKTRTKDKKMRKLECGKKLNSIGTFKSSDVFVDNISFSSFGDKYPATFLLLSL